jgi:RNA polymerase sigma-70 factor (ECF subfamily)
MRETYQLHAQSLRRFAGARLRDPDKAEDVVQEAFVRLAIEVARRRYPRNPRAWLHRVVLNLIYSAGRHAAVAQRLNIQTIDDVVRDSPEARYLESERQALLRAALAAVSPDGRSGLILAAQGYSGLEIAEAIGRSAVATRALMCRTRRRVRRQLMRQDVA